MMMMTLSPHRRPSYVCDTLKDLRAACLVCRAWRESALVPLYARVILHSPQQLDLFLRSLEHYKALASLVRSIQLPDETQSLPEHLPAARPFGYQKRRLWDLGRAVGLVLERCSTATEIAFRVNTPKLSFVHGYDSNAHRIQRLELSAGPRNDPTQILRETALPILRLPTLPIADPLITHLTLYGLHVFPAHELIRFPRLVTLRIHFCVAAMGWLDRILDRCPVLEILQIEAFAYDTRQRWNLSELRPASNSLRQLRLDWSRRDLGQSLSFLQYLTLLELSVRTILDDPSPIDLPSNLETLIFSTRGFVFRGEYGGSRCALISAVGALQRRLPSWKRASTPNLVNLQLSGDGAVGHCILWDWAIASFLLQPFCRSLGVNLDIFLFIVSAPQKRRGF
ncbi:hypothetical protein EXIGLDRAFT_520637 [Exidia glandulosa HHB12029]|uniref:F-box/LRR-repeat protein 15/At3g58940/PEG3-like LRR domain-containing protein n=1 Tax=Exidia glandulosa HHB12029 TaxID=1314781 RepID=A0A166N0Q0_EXIGL|nr:hypothetical protein EXIGLDRAFT_520637 [Exidia glandulosa HHB12029]